MHGHCESIGTLTTRSPASKVSPVSSVRPDTNSLIFSSYYRKVPSLTPDGCTSSSPSSPRDSSSRTCELITSPSLSGDLASLHRPRSPSMSDSPDCELPSYKALPTVLGVSRWYALYESCDGCLQLWCSTKKEYFQSSLREGW